MHVSKGLNVQEVSVIALLCVPKLCAPNAASFERRQVACMHALTAAAVTAGLLRLLFSTACPPHAQTLNQNQPALPCCPILALSSAGPRRGD